MLTIITFYFTVFLSRFGTFLTSLFTFAQQLNVQIFPNLFKLSIYLNAYLKCKYSDKKSIKIE